MAEIDRRGVFGETGYGCVANLLADVTNVTKREALKRANRANAMFPGVGISGAEVPALAPLAGDALAAGALGVEHVDQIHKTMVEIPGDVPEEARDHVERTLVDLAKKASPHEVGRAGDHALARLDPDGSEPVDNELAHPERELRLGWRRDGRLGFAGTLDAETGMLFERLLSPLSKPTPSHEGERDGRSPGEQRGVSQRDARTADERRGDGFAELLELVHRSCAMPSEKGDRPTVVVTLDLHALVDNLPATTAAGQPLSAGQVRRLACDSNVIPAVLGADSEVLDLGRQERLVSRGQRRALNLRDKGCIKCGRPPQWCQAHHIEHWIDGGPQIWTTCVCCAANVTDSSTTPAGKYKSPNTAPRNVSNLNGSPSSHNSRRGTPARRVLRASQPSEFNQNSSGKSE